MNKTWVGLVMGLLLLSPVTSAQIWPFAHTHEDDEIDVFDIIFNNPWLKDWLESLDFDELSVGNLFVSGVLNVTNTTVINATFFNTSHITTDTFSCTDCIGADEVEDIYVFTAGDTMTGNLVMSTADILLTGAGDSIDIQDGSLTITDEVLFGTDADWEFDVSVANGNLNLDHTGDGDDVFGLVGSQTVTGTLNITNHAQFMQDVLVTEGSNRALRVRDGSGDNIFTVDTTDKESIFAGDATPITIGDGEAGLDYILTFDGENADGLITWLEDEDRFDLNDDIAFNNPVSMGDTTPSTDFNLNARRDLSGTLTTDEAVLSFFLADSSSAGVFNPSAVSGSVQILGSRTNQRSSVFKVTHTVRNTFTGTVNRMRSLDFDVTGQNGATVVATGLTAFRLNHDFEDLDVTQANLIEWIPSVDIGNVTTLRGFYAREPTNGTDSFITTARVIDIEDYSFATNVDAIRIEASKFKANDKMNINMIGGTWNEGHIQLGGLHIWSNSTNALCIGDAPTSENDGLCIEE